MKTLLLLAVTFAGFIWAQGTTTAKTAPAETPEHSFARSQYELAKHEFEESQKDYEEKFKQNNNCQALDVFIHHPVSVDSVDANMVGCNYETRKARFVMEKIGEMLAQLKTQLDDVDDCLKVYRTTIDKKVSDQTQREVGQIKVCQAEHLYPPPTK